MAEAAGHGVGATSASVRVLLPNGVRIETWPADGVGDEAAATFPVAYHGEDVGEIAVTKPRGEPLTHAEEELLRDLAGQAGLALHNVRLNEELAIRLVELDEQAAALRLSRERLVTARDAQRRGLQRDIHEGPEHELRLIRQRLDTMADLAGTDPTAAGAALDALGERSNATLEALRDLARGIFPPLLADQGIVPALEAHARKVGANATVRPEPGFTDRRFDADTEACVYFCCLQAIQNVIRHAGNAPAEVSLGVEDGTLWFTIHDDGPGYDMAQVHRGMGLDIMQDRVDALEGSLATASVPGAGTTVRIRIPLTSVGATA
jgi:signal transduction histidine kinase